MSKLHYMLKLGSKWGNISPSIPYHLRVITIFKNLHNDGLDKVSSSLSPLRDWKPIYRFRHIISARSIQRLKVYQTGFTCFVILPWSLAASHFGYASINLAYTGFGLSALACLMLIIMGTMSSRVIGILYVNNDSSQIRVARLSFFGSRVDKVLPANFFVPITDTSQSLEDVYIVLNTINTDEAPSSIFEEILPSFLHDKYYISLKYGIILDPETFCSIFGDVTQLLVKKK